MAIFSTCDPVVVKTDEQNHVPMQTFEQYLFLQEFPTEALLNEHLNTSIPRNDTNTSQDSESDSVSTVRNPRIVIPLLSKFLDIGRIGFILQNSSKLDVFALD